MVINRKEKLLLEYIISDINIFVTTLRVLKAEYFSSPLNEVVVYVVKYHDKHNGIPDVDIIEAETGVLLKLRETDQSERSYVLEEIELFCREAAMRNALMMSADLIHDSTRLQEVESLVRDALMVKIDNSVGINLFDNTLERINTTEESRDLWLTGIDALDSLTGGLGVSEVMSIFAETSAGKSVLLANITDRAAMAGMNVLVISLEMSEISYAQRLDSIITNNEIKKHSEMADIISQSLLEKKETYGNITVKRLPYGTTVSDIRSVALEYALLYGYNPDLFVIDYLALMGDGNGGRSGAFEEMENIAFGIKDLMEDLKSRCATAGQLNRDGYDVIAIRPNMIAGGISLINALDSAVGMAQTEADIENNQVQLVQMKVRSHTKTRDPNILYRCPKTLRMDSKPFTYEQKQQSVKADVKGTSKDANSRNSMKKELTQSAGKAKLSALLKR